MATLNPFKSNKGITLVRNGVITLTKRTVRFSKNVYQTHNITGFSEGEVDIGTIPWWIIIIFTLLSFSLNVVIKNSLDWYCFIPALGCLAWNFYKPKHYGLLLSLNSGDKTLFTTTKTESLKEIIIEIYNFIEADKEATYQISISNSKVIGNLIQGDVTGNTLCLSDD